MASACFSCGAVRVARSAGHQVPEASAESARSPRSDSMPAAVKTAARRLFERVEDAGIGQREVIHGPRHYSCTDSPDY